LALINSPAGNNYRTIQLYCKRSVPMNSFQNSTLIMSCAVRQRIRLLQRSMQGQRSADFFICTKNRSVF